MAEDGTKQIFIFMRVTFEYYAVLGHVKYKMEDEEERIEGN